MTPSQLLTFERGRYSSEVAAKMLNLPSSWGGTADAPITSIDMAYRYVPWFKRAVKLRANAIGRFPLALYKSKPDGTPDTEQDVSEDPAYQAVMLWTRALLTRTEMNLIKYGAAYHLIERNIYGANWTPRFLPTNSVQPISNYRDGVTGFRVAWVDNNGAEIPLSKMVWVWEPNDESEIEPGPSDGLAALKAAGLLYAIDEMANRYMGSGGVPVTAVRVPPTVDKDERVKIENFLTRFMGGFRNAFRFMTVDKNTEFETLGSEMKDIQAPELTATQRDNVAVALGVPPTVLDGKSANYATAQSEMTGFYMNTVIPQAEMLEPILNTQLYQRIGLTLRFNPDQLEVMQAIQLEQAQGVVELAGGKQLLSVNEAREIIEYDELPGDLGEWKEPEPPTIVAPPGAAVGASAGSAAAPLDEADPEDPQQMKTWKDAALAAVKAGQSAAVGTPFDDELTAASSGKMVRNIFEHHWPRSQSAAVVDWQTRAVIALEQYNALVAGS